MGILPSKSEGAGSKRGEGTAACSEACRRALPWQTRSFEGQVSVSILLRREIQQKIKFRVSGDTRTVKLNSTHPKSLKPCASNRQALFQSSGIRTFNMPFLSCSMTEKAPKCEKTRVLMPH